MSSAICWICLPEGIISSIDEELEKGNDFASLLQKITTENENLRSSWTGADAEKYTSAVMSEIDNMKVLNKAINEMGQFLIEAANAYEKVNETNQEGIR